MNQLKREGKGSYVANLTYHVEVYTANMQRSIPRLFYKLSEARKCHKELSEAGYITTIFEKDGNRFLGAIK